MRAKALFLAAAFSTAAGAIAAQYDVAAYVWPAFQPDPRWAELGIFKDGRGEWQNLYEAEKRYPDDYQGVKPLWGYEDESDPIVVARKIDAATAAGVNVFIYDWYWYDRRPFLEQCLDNGYLRAKNNDLVKFFLMWANHDANHVWNINQSDSNGSTVIWEGSQPRPEFEKIVHLVIDMYFSHPSYYKIDGKPVCGRDLALAKRLQTLFRSYFWKSVGQ